MKSNVFFLAVCSMICAFAVSSCSKSLNLDRVDSGALISLDDDRQIVATSIGSYDISYNSVGLPTRVGRDYIDYDDMTIYIGGVEYDFTMDNKGHITSVSGTDIESHKESSSLTVKLSYDGAGHLVSVTGKGKSKWDENGEMVSETTEMKSTITWKKDLITKVTIVYEEQSKYDGETVKSKETEVYTPAYEEYNPLFQYTVSFESMINVFDNGFALAGLLGKAPSALPAEIHLKYTDWNNQEGTDEKENTYCYTYYFNEDGTISTESRKVSGSKWGSASYRYLYKNFISTKAEWLPAVEESPAHVSLYMRVFHPHGLDR